VKTQIVFLQIPEGLRKHFGDFVIDPKIPIPVALEEGKEKLDLEELSWEMIIFGMIQALIDKPDSENAEYYRNFVLKIKPNILAEFIQAALMKTRNNDYEFALEIIVALIALFPYQPDVLTNHAFILEEYANYLEKTDLKKAEILYNEADNAYQKVLCLEPPFPAGLFNAGYFFMKRNNFEDAKNCFYTFLNISDEDDPKQKKVRNVLKEIKRRSLDDNNLKSAYNNIREENVEKGLEDIRIFLEQHPDVWNGWFILGWGLRKLKRWEDSISAFRKTIELGGANSNTRNELAICLMETGDLLSAKRELEIALHEEPENIKIISNLGILALKNKNQEEAEKFFRIVLELEPNDPVARSYFNTY